MAILGVLAGVEVTSVERSLVRLANVLLVTVGIDCGFGSG